MKTALLLSGGMDSLSIAWWKRPDVATLIDYGQLAAQADVFDYIERFYSPARRHSTLGYVSPVEFEKVQKA